MYLKKDSFVVVLLGDWNKYYIQPEWISENVFEEHEIEIGVRGEGLDLIVSYRNGDIVIVPGQSKTIFTALNTSNQTLEKTIKCINNFLAKANTPILEAYGLNCDYIESDGSIYADMTDSMKDNTAFIDCGYQICNTNITRKLKKDRFVLNVEFSMENGDDLKIHFNEHHGELMTEMPQLSIENVNNFLESCKKIVMQLGYEIEEAE